MNDVNDDVFDEELMKELGLTAEDISETPKPGREPSRAPAPPPAAPVTQSRAVPPRPETTKVAPPPAPPVAPKAAVTQPRAQAPAAPIQTAPQDFSSQAQKIAEDIPVQLAAVLAKKSIALKDILEMQVGEVIDFKKATQEPLDLVANGKLVAKAELVLVDGKLGAKIVKLMK